MDGYAVITFGLIGFTLSWLSVPLIQRYLQPSARRQMHHTHTGPISRFGGLALAIPFVAIAALAFWFYPAGADRTQERWVVTGSSLAMFLLGFIDDAWPLGAKRKLLGQVLIASLVYFAGLHIGTLRNPFTGADHALGWMSYFATVFWLVAFTNLINLIDGVDGLAAGISLIVMSLLLYVGLHSDLVFPILCAAGLCGALLGFLFYNFPPAKIYLGDGGAYFLGFLIGLISMLHSHKGTVAAALIAPLFVLALPIVDVALAILRRGVKGVSIFRPDRRHLHHRLAEAGLSRTRIVLMFYGCSLFFLLLAFGVMISEGRWVPFLFGLACLVLLISARSFSFSREWFAVGKVLGNSLELRKQARYALALGRWLELEAERTRSPEDLWSDFGFLSRKLGFTAVTLVTPEGRKHWNWTTVAQHPRGPQPHRKRYDPAHATGTALEFLGPANLDSHTFELLSELAAESWLKGIERWQLANQMPFRFGAPQAPAGTSPIVLALPLTAAAKSRAPQARPA